MPNRQFSIPDPFRNPDEAPRRIMIDYYGGDEYLIEVGDKTIRFEWSEMFGPIPINKDGSECLSIGPKHSFWRAASLWNLQGRRIEDSRAIWHEPRQPIYETIPIGKARSLFITKVIDPGEPGHDW